MKIGKSELKEIVLEVLAEELDAGHEDALALRDEEEPSKNAKLKDEDKNEKDLKKAREEDIEETEERKEIRNRGNDASLTIHTTDTVVQETGINRIKMSKKAYVIDENNKQNVIAINIAKSSVNRLGTLIKNSSVIDTANKANYLKELKKTMNALKSIREEVGIDKLDSDKIMIENLNEAVSSKKYKLNIRKNIQLKGDGWGNIDGVAKVSGITIVHSDYGDGNDWYHILVDHNKHWELYHDSDFAKGITDIFRKLLGKSVSVGFTEQGMQNNKKASMEMSIKHQKILAQYLASKGKESKKKIPRQPTKKRKIIRRVT